MPSTENKFYQPPAFRYDVDNAYIIHSIDHIFCGGFELRKTSVTRDRFREISSQLATKRIAHYMTVDNKGFMFHCRGGGDQRLSAYVPEDPIYDESFLIDLIKAVSDSGYIFEEASIMPSATPDLKGGL